MSGKQTHGNILRDILSVTYGHRNKVFLSNRTADNLNFTQRLTLVNRLNVHNGCVNTIAWNDTGQYILSGSDDQHLVVTNAFSGKVEFSFRSGHHANIFSAKFLPNTQDRQTISCSADGLLYYCDFDRPETLCSNGFDCHSGAVYEVLTVPNDPYTFVSCGEDGTLRWFDLRTKTKCFKANCEDDVMINCRQPVMSLALNPMRPFQLAVGCADSSVRVYDRRQIATGPAGNADSSSGSGAILHFFSAPAVQKRNHRITSLVYSRDGDELLVSYSSEHLYLFNFKEKEGKNHVPLMKSFKDLEDVSDRIVGEDGSSASASTSSSSETAASSECFLKPGILKQPPLKRLRLRGDWSDTGPNARPERERERIPQDENATSVMQRMSNMLTRLLESRMTGDRSVLRAENGPPDGPPGTEDSTSDSPGNVPENPASTTGVEDGDGATPENSLSNSDASGVFVSFSVSEKAESSDNSKDSFESTAEPTCIRINRDGEESGDPSPCAGSLLKTNFRRAETSSAEGSSAESENVASVEAPDLTLTGNHMQGDAITMEKMSSLFEHQDVSDFTSGMEPVKENERSDLSDGALVTHCDVTNAAPVISDSDEQNSEMTPSDPVDSKEQTTSVSGCSVEIKTLNEVVRLPKQTDHDTRQMDFLTSEHQKDDPGSILNDSEASNASLDRTDFDTSVVSVGQCETLESNETVKDRPLPSAKQHRNSTDGTLESCTKDQSLINLPEHSNSLQLERLGPRHENRTDLVPTESAAAAAQQPVIEKENALPSTSLCSSRNALPQKSARTCGVEPERSQGKGTVGTDGEQGSRFVGFAGANADTEDSDDEESYASAASRETYRRQRLEEKNAAASKLQALFRQRLEQRSRNRSCEVSLSLPKPVLKQCYIGHRNSRTMIKEASFWGDHYVMSGSDCGHIFVWDRQTARLVMLLEGDRHVVNCLQPHPFDPILASSGIDYDVKIWMPALETPGFDRQRAAELMRRNEIMLEETRDTVTVPASFMLRMLLSLNHTRRGNRSDGSHTADGSPSSSASSRDD